MSPGLKFMVHEAFPNIDLNTLGAFYYNVNAGAIAQTGMGIQFASIDWDWHDGGTAGMINLLQNYVNSFGVSLNLVYWRAQNTMTWEQALIHQGNLVKNAGFEPNMYSVLNWTEAPGANLPEATPGTFMRAVRQFVNVFLPQPTSTHGLASDQYLLPNEFRLSVDGRFRLTYQGDGNLVLRRTSDNGLLWNAQTQLQVTWPYVAGGAWMQGVDGNFVVYKYNTGTAQYEYGGFSSSNPYVSRPGSYLIVQSDGNVVVYYGKTAVWSTNTAWY